MVDATSDPSGWEESSCLKFLLDKRDASLGPWIPGRYLSNTVYFNSLELAGELLVIRLRRRKTIQNLWSSFVFF